MKVQQLVDHEQTPVSMEGACGARMRMLVGPAEGARNFHMRHFEVSPGGYTPHHQHNYEHEILVLKGEGLAGLWPNLVALGVFVCVVTALAMLRYRRTLD